jgi:hypothetical protein
MVLTKIDSDAILVEPMKNRTRGKMIRANQTLINQLRTTNIVPKLHILDNECSQDFKDTINLNDMAFQPCSPAQSLAQPGGVGHPDLQRPFYCHPTQSRQVLPSESLGQIAATGQTYAQHALAIPNDTNNIRVRLLVEAT